jgi:hypothetical protein
LKTSFRLRYTDGLRSVGSSWLASFLTRWQINVHNLEGSKTMARIRSIKHDFFLDEELAECEMSARLLFAGLWVIADKAGRLADRPLMIKAKIFPYDNLDINVLLTQLADHNLIIRYRAEGRSYIQIRTFTRHQKPHPKEPESEIPPPSILENESMHEPSAVEKHGSAVERNSRNECTETNTEGSSRRNGSSNGSGDGSGDFGSLGSGDGLSDSAKAGASADSEPERDFKTFAIWDSAIGALTSKGMSEQAARSFMGLQCKNYGNEAVAEAVIKTLAHSPVDPRGYLIRLLQDRQKPPPGRLAKVDVSMGNVGKVLAEKEAQRDAVAS